MNNTQLYNKNLLQAKRKAEELTTLRDSSKEKAKKLEELDRKISNNTDAFCEKYGINIDSSEVIAISAKLKSLIQYLNTKIPY